MQPVTHNLGQLLPDISQTLSDIAYFSQTSLKFPDISREVMTRLIPTLYSVISVTSRH